MFQVMLTPAAGKRLIGKALARHPLVQNTLSHGTLVIIAGTTNAYVAAEILQDTGQQEGFCRERFFRGIVMPPHYRLTETGRLHDAAQTFPGDVVIRDGIWQRGLTLYDVQDDLWEGDLILKGANAVNLTRRQAAVLIGHPEGGTAAVILKAVTGRRVQLLVPVGVEKRVDGDINSLAILANSPGAQGYRFLPLPGEICTELDALRELAGVEASILAAGGVCGAEGAVRLLIRGEREQEEKARNILEAIKEEPPFNLDAVK